MESTIYADNLHSEKIQERQIITPFLLVCFHLP